MIFIEHNATRQNDWARAEPLWPGSRRLSLPETPFEGHRHEDSETTLLAGAIATAALPLLAACGGSDDDTPAASLGTIVDIASADSNFSVLVEAVVAADLVDTLNGTGPFTVFAPTNDAFVALLDDLGLTKDALLANKDLLTAVLNYHVVAGRNLSTGLSAGQLPTRYNFDGAPAELALSLSSGVKLTDAVLTEATVTTPDIEASNGVIHVIDKVLVPPGVFNVVQMAQLNPNFSSLVAAVVQADLAGTLSDATASLTVFAPVNTAFADIATTVASLDNSGLKTVLLHHVLGSEVLSSGIPFGTPVDTLTQPLSSPQKITINNNATAPAIATITDASGTTPASNIVAVDVRASNGVIHVIDKVLIPVLSPT